MSNGYNSEQVATAAADLGVAASVNSKAEAAHLQLEDDHRVLVPNTPDAEGRHTNSYNTPQGVAPEPNCEEPWSWADWDSNPSGQYIPQGSSWYGSTTDRDSVTSGQPIPQDSSWFGSLTDRDSVPSDVVGQPIGNSASVVTSPLAERGLPSGGQPFRSPGCPETHTGIIRSGQLCIDCQNTAREVEESSYTANWVGKHCLAAKRQTRSGLRKA